MYCQHCGKELATAATTCSACGAPVFYPPTAAGSPDQVEQVAADLKRAAKDLAVNAARLSQRMAAKAETAAKDPSGTAKRAARRVAKELDAVAQEVDKILKDL